MWCKPVYVCHKHCNICFHASLVSFLRRCYATFYFAVLFHFLSSSSVLNPDLIILQESESFQQLKRTFKKRTLFYIKFKFNVPYVKFHRFSKINEKWDHSDMRQFSNREVTLRTLPFTKNVSGWWKTEVQYGLDLYGITRMWNLTRNLNGIGTPIIDNITMSWRNYLMINDDQCIPDFLGNVDEMQLTNLKQNTILFTDDMPLLTLATTSMYPMSVIIAL